MADLNRCQDLAAFLGAVREADPELTVAHLQALLLVAAGEADHVSTLREAMPTASGEPMPLTTATQVSQRLRGRGRSPVVTWLKSRPHPHRPGLQLLPATNTRQLLKLWGVS